MTFKKPPLYGVALYKYAWTLFKQQRYDAATREFVHLLLYTDEQQKETGDPGADFRGEAYTYIAGSLTNVDFVGPAPDDPFIQRDDILDDPKLSPDMIQKKMHVAIDRVGDATLIPQDKPWTIEIYKSLAEEFRSLNQFDNAIEVYNDILKKWPMDPTAPEGTKLHRRDLRPDELDDASGHSGARRDRGQSAERAHGIGQLHRQHAVGRCEQGQSASAGRRGKSWFVVVCAKLLFNTPTTQSGIGVGDRYDRSQSTDRSADARRSGIQTGDHRLVRLLEARRERARCLRKSVLAGRRAAPASSYSGRFAQAEAGAVRRAGSTRDRGRKSSGGRRS